MDDSVKLQGIVACVFVLGVCTQWIAWKIKLPAILLLLIVGRIAGPITGFLRPSEIFGELFLPCVSLSVGMILFEGGLNLRFRELRTTWRSLLGLLTVGVVVTWVAVTLLAMLLLDMQFSHALLLGSILVVTGPTVVGPLLRDIRPTGRVSAIAKWEGIAIDPIGATLALLVFEAIEAIQKADYGTATTSAFVGLATTGLVGTVVGLLAGRVLVIMLRNFWVPDHLRNPMALMFVVIAFVVSNLFHHESGLLAVTIMGIALANQRQVDVRHIVEFKESLTVLLIASLFILISASVPLNALLSLGWKGPVFAALLILVVRPLAVWLATLGSGLSYTERVFLSWLAPRGIVAAAISSVFAARLGDAGQPLVPATLIVIFMTVATYGLSAGWLARRLGISVVNPQGLLIAGANKVARAIATAVANEGFTVVLVDSNYEHIRKARDAGLSTCYANVMSEHVLEEIDLGSLGKFLGLTPSNKVNTLASARFREVFGREHVYQLADSVPRHLRWEAEWQAHLAGQSLFASDLSYETLENCLENGGSIHTTRLTSTFNYEAFMSHNSDGNRRPLFFVSGDRLSIVTSKSKSVPKPGQLLVCVRFPMPSVELPMATGESEPRGNILPSDNLTLELEVPEHRDARNAFKLASGSPVRAVARKD